MWFLFLFLGFWFLGGGIWIMSSKKRAKSCGLTKSSLIFNWIVLICVYIALILVGISTYKENKEKKAYLKRTEDAKKEERNRLLDRAYSGDARAQYELAKCYSLGKGVEINHNSASKWLRTSAENGCQIAQVAMGNRFLAGKGVSKDFEEAVSWFKKAAEQGNSDGQYYLGRCYHMGWGVSIDNKKALYWYKKAAEQGNKTAIDALEYFYPGGMSNFPLRRGTPQKKYDPTEYEMMAEQILDELGY